MPRVNLTEAVLTSGPPLGAVTTWWDRYVAHGLLPLSRTAQSVLEMDARAIVRDCIPSPSRQDAWADTHVRTGVVVGAVQSGKTGSMLAISALLLDGGADIVVLLAGTRIALWKQTYERVLKHLDGSTPGTSADRWSARVLVPQPIAMLRIDARTSPSAYMTAASSKIEQALLERRPTILIIPKVDAHLLAASRALHDRIERAMTKIDRTLHMVVLDDEADDASVLDAIDSKTIPRRVEMLWSGKRHGQTVHDRLYATYVAYTATPQANFLQQAHNPLAPRDFCAALRTPYKSGGTGTPRSVTFVEPEGIRRYYCGGEFFYGEFPAGRQAGGAGGEGGNASFCHLTSHPSRATAVDDADHERRVRAAADAILIDGLRAYLVAAAIRVVEARHQGRFLPSEIPQRFSEAESARLPPPSSMLVHPSARQDVHFDEARRLVLLSAGLDPDHHDNAQRILGHTDLVLDTEALRAHLHAYESSWRQWARSYSATLRSIATWPGAADLFLPSDAQWDEVATAISDEVLPHVCIRIINSDPLSDDRPAFDPVEVGGGLFSPPPDLLTIFVSGNVMSRGLTIEGLTTSAFTRPASEPVADTQMQMQRWFGYRGSHAHLCRVFLFDDQLELFRTYHEHDVAMRTEILASMDRGEVGTPNVVLQGPRSLATAKVPTSRLPLHPGPTPSVKLLEADDRPASCSNADLLAHVLADGPWTYIGPKEQPRGRLRTVPVDLRRVAELLEAFRYSTYDPARINDDDVRFSRWRSLEDQLHLLPAERPLFRPPNRLSTTIELDPRACPYSIAAYLRLWAAALKRPQCDGLYPSDAEGASWALAQPMMRPPDFYLGVAYGEGGLSRWPQLASRGVRTMKRGEAPGTPRMLNTLWGRRSEGGRYFGDQLFDYNYTGLKPPRLLSGAPPWRERGHPGLLLFHVVRPETAPFDGVTVGLAIPHGGPEQFAALSGP